MCYIFSCFGWLLDFIQRVVTFALACWMSCAVCLGLAIAAIAGIAYGYNYQMAEWLTFTKSDVTVYMRRGQFYDKPDVKPNYISRRSGSDDDVFQQHVGGEDEYVAPERGPPDFPDAQNAAKALPESWSGLRNANHFVDSIRKFNKEAVGQVMTEDSVIQMDITRATEPTPLDYYRLTTPPSRLKSKQISIIPNPILSTAVYNSGNSKIIMRNFQIPTMKDIDPDSYKAYPGDYIDRDEVIDSKYSKDDAKDYYPPRKEAEPKVRPTLRSDSRRREELKSSSATVVMRHWGPTTTPIFQDYTEEVNENNIVYKPG